MAAFTNRAVSFPVTADPPYAWTGAFDLAFPWSATDVEGSSININVRVQLTGVATSASLRQTWETGIESTWNQKVFFDDGTRLYEVKLNEDFVASGAHHLVEVHAGNGRADLANWYAGETTGVAAAHEVGHMLGNYDEYAGGGTKNGFVRTGTLMSDLTVAGFQDYFKNVETYAEQFSGSSFSLVLATLGTSGNNTIAGTSGKDGVYGLAGNDTISGGAGRDFLDGGDGNDTLRGEADDDILRGGAGNDTLDGGTVGPHATSTSSQVSVPGTTEKYAIKLIAPKATDDGTARVAGSITKSGGTQHYNVAYVIDVSGSMSSAFSGNETVPNLNGNSTANERMDGAIYAFERLNASLIASGLTDANVAIIPFSDNASITFRGLPGQVGNAFRSLVPTDNTNYEAGLKQAITFLSQAGAGKNVVFFISDGQPNGNPYVDEVAQLIAASGINAKIYAYGLGAGATTPELDQVDDGLANGTGIPVLRPSQLASSLNASGTGAADIDRVEIYVNSVLRKTLLPSELKDDGFGLKFATEVSGLSLSQSDTIEARLILKDPAHTTARTSVTVDNFSDDDFLIGGIDNDIYQFATGFGHDTIIEAGGTADEIRLPVTLSDYRIMTNQADHNALDIIVADIDVITIRDYYLGGNNSVERIVFSDGSTSGIALKTSGAGLTMAGTQSADYARGTDADDVISTYDGDDQIVGGSGGGNDFYDGGDGSDTVIYTSATIGITVNLAAASGQAFGSEIGTDQLLGIENVIGGSGSDTIIGDGNGNYLEGGPGDDQLTGAGGLDFLNGGAGLDTANFASGFTQNAVQNFGNVIFVVGGEGGDTVWGVERLKFTDRTIDPSAYEKGMFDELYYLSTNGDVLGAGVPAHAHYDQFGWKENRDPNAVFDTSGYKAIYTDVKNANINPLEHYHQNGWKEGRDPGADFDTTLYLVTYGDVRAAGVDPLEHYIMYGRAEGRQAFEAIGKTVSGFDAEYYLLHNPDVAAAGIDPLQHYNQYGWREGRDPNAYFDSAGYLARYTDVKNAGINPLAHYEQFGWTEGRDPSAAFDTIGYLNAYPDVKNVAINPLDHFLNFGIYEGRSTFGDGLWH